MIFDLTGFATIGGRVRAYVTSPACNLKYIPGPSLDTNRFRAALPAHSTTTFAIDDCRMR
jgi:O-glycosyl hydrolase